MLKELISLTLTGSLAAVVLSVGLDARVSDLLYFVRNPIKFVFAFIAICVVAPVTAVAMTGVFPLREACIAGIVLMAVSPVPPFVPSKGLKVGGDKEYAYSLYVTFALLSVITVPVSVAILSRVYGSSVAIGPAAIAQLILTSVVAPVAVGMTLRALFPAMAAKAAPLVGRIGMALALLVAIVLVVKAWPAIVQAAGDGTIAAIVIIVAAALAGGHLLGGPQRTTLAVTSATRHPGMALLIANANFTDARITAVVLMFLLVGVAAGMPYQMWAKRAARPPAAHVAPSR
jgi:BASS family bile acid:Na+ symporter